MTLVAAACLALLWGAAPALAGDDLCGELWSERNSVYKDAGYCFKTTKAIRAFGNAGCQYDDIGDVPLSANDRRKVAEIEREERANGCPR